MKMAKTYQKHVYCLEGDWNKDLRDPSSVQAALMFLQHNFGIQFIHRHCGTKESLLFYLKTWKQKKYKSYPICYFAFHGKPGHLRIGNEFVSLDELAETLKNSCKGKIIHFGSCETLNTDRKNIMKFLEKTGAICVCGFKKEIDFLEGSIFDMLLIDMLQYYMDISLLEKEIKQNYAGLVNKLEFKIFCAP